MQNKAFRGLLAGLTLLCSISLSAAPPQTSPPSEIFTVNTYLDHLDSVLEIYRSQPQTRPRDTDDAYSIAPPPAPSSLTDVLIRLHEKPELVEDQESFFAPYFGQRPQRGRWLLIETDQQTLTVMQDSRPVKVYDNIATGRGGLAWFKVRDDEKTVLGTFYINLINPASQYRVFFRFAYPTHAHFEYALSKGLISPADYATALAHYRRYGAFPQDTVLGGHLGLHGLGEADYDTHLMFNWTRGCIALSNEQIESLRKEIEFGTLVVIE